MSLPETILLNLVQRMGITPAQIQQSMGLIEKLSSVAAEAQGFKAGAQAAIGHFSGRLDAIDAHLSRIETLLATLSPTLGAVPLGITGGDTRQTELDPTTLGTWTNGRHDG